MQVGGELGELIRTHDWSRTALGPPGQWPQSLKTSVGIMLSARQPIWIGWGPDLVYLYNDPYKSIIGGKHPWALGRPTREVWREIWTEIAPMLATAQRGEEGTYVESQLLIMERNGYPEETYYTFSYSPIPAEDGSTGGIICANTDDTQRVIGERQLALLRDLAASTADAREVSDAAARAARALGRNTRDLPFALIYLADADGELRLAGASGIEPGHAIAARHVDDDALHGWPWAALRARGAEAQVVALADAGALPHGAWTRPPQQAALIPIAAAGDRGTPGVLVVGLNPYRLFDAGYRDFLDLVAGQITLAVSTAQAYEDERRRAETLAELDRAKTQFFSNVSHEFRTPLTLMLGPLQDALHDVADAAQRERLEIALANARRLLKLVNALLDFTRVEAGRASARFEATDLAAYTADIASTFRSAMERAGLRYTVACEPLPAPIAVDRTMWEKIVLNLVSNAFKFTLEGEVAVRLAPAPGGDGALLVVSDTGAGIPEAALPRLFERFHRIEGQRGRSFEGSGIGLALVQELVRQHEGSISVDSVENRGSSFTVWIPAREAPARAPAPDDANDTTRRLQFLDEALGWLPDADAPDGGTAPLAPRFAGASLLMADDNADMRRYVRGLLGAHVEVVTVADGLAALDALRAKRPDLLLTDVMMPRLDGFGLLAAVRADPELRDLPVIMLSARAGEEARVEGLEAGADDYLIKPFTARELVARVESNLRLGRERRQAMGALREQTRMLQALNRTAATLAGQLDVERVVQSVTDAGVELTGAQFGAFFYNVVNAAGESYTLYTLSGVPREAFSKFPMPRNTAVFAPTFSGEATVRSDDITADPRYGHNAPRRGMPEGHLPVRSYLAVPVKSNRGEVIGGLFFGHSEPARFTAEHEALMSGLAGQASVAFENARQYSHLEDRVTQEVERRSRAEEALRQSQKMEALGKLTGGVAHDFNNLLHVISMNLQLIGRSIAGRPDALERVEKARASVARGAKLASQLLAFGRRQPLEPKVIDLRRFIAGIDDMLRRSLGGAIEIETITGGGLWNTFADPDQLEHAILNLAINARDAMQGVGKLTLEIGNAHLDHAYALQNAEVQPGQYVVLTVTDTGSGMAPEIVEKVFEPFFTTKEEGKGTGLGLSQVYGFAKQSGGHVKIYSEVGEGTSVKLYLPRSRQAAEPVADVDTGPVVGGSETVLVVEDDDNVRSTVVEMLRDLGYAVLKASDAESAMTVLDSGAPVDLLFTDVVMPGRMRSTELAAAARRKFPGLPVLFTSGYTENAIVHAGRLDEGVELISKPYTREALARRIRQLLGAARAAPDARAPAGLRILFVEDEPAVRFSTAELLGLLGHEVLAVEDEPAALAALEAARYDLLFTDVGLVNGDGRHLAALAAKRDPELAILFATGRDLDLVPGEYGPRTPLLLRKPYDVQQVERALAQVTRRD